jgi:alpha-D-ribose 1-methylphosphonate 5-triphosphate synthase subunit PhnG
MNIKNQAMPAEQTTRQHWMGILAKADYSVLAERWNRLNLDPECEIIRQPEISLARLQGRVGGSGERFNLGDTTLTRAAVRLSDGTLGYGYLQGRAKQHALLSAIIDALLQTAEFAPTLQEAIIQPLAAQQLQSAAQKSAHVAHSKVDFFTLVRGEN